MMRMTGNVRSGFPPASLILRRFFNTPNRSKIRVISQLWKRSDPARWKRRLRPRRPLPLYDRRRTTAIDVARFGILSVIALPFSLWIGLFTYSYVYRVDLCRETLEREEGGGGGAADRRRREQGDLCFGRVGELAEAEVVLRGDPEQIIVVAGSNEAGKSIFVSKLLSGREKVTVVRLAQLLDSTSSLTEVFVEKFGLRWLHLRHMLVDMLPFAGSEILVMKERFSGRDLEQALRVASDALKRLDSSSKPSTPKPVIVIDGLGEGDKEFMRSREWDLCLQRLLQWCVYVTKERRLAHIILTGNEQLVLGLSEHNRHTRGHIKVVGLGELQLDHAVQLVLRELPGASPEEIQKLTGTFGGWIHDLRGACRDMKSQLDHQVEDGSQRIRILEEIIKVRQQNRMERVISAFAKGAEKENLDRVRDKDDDGPDEDAEDMDPFLDPLKLVYSEQQAQKSALANTSVKSSIDMATWNQLQLWQTLQRTVNSDGMAVPFAELRDDVFDGDGTPILDLMHEDILGFMVSPLSGGTAWHVTPATPALGRAFKQLLDHGNLKERFSHLEQENKTKEKIRQAEKGRLQLGKERKIRELRKASLMNTLKLSKGLGRGDKLCETLGSILDSIVLEEATHEVKDRNLREKIQSLRNEDIKDGETDIDEESQVNDKALSANVYPSLQGQLKAAVLQILAREEVLLHSLKSSDLPRLEATFREFDSTKTGALTVKDLGRIISSVTGESVDEDAINKLLHAWDHDASGKLEYEEFIQMLGIDPKQVAIHPQSNM